MKRLCLALAIGTALSANGVAQEIPNPLPVKTRERLNDYSADMQTCQVYNLVALQCFSGQDQSQLEPIRRTADAFGDLAVNAGKVAGLSNKAILARSSILVEQMKEDISNDCINISVLLSKFAKKCKAEMEGSGARLERILSAK